MTSAAPDFQDCLRRIQFLLDSAPPRGGGNKLYLSSLKTPFVELDYPFLMPPVPVAAWQPDILETLIRFVHEQIPGWIPPGSGLYFPDHRHSQVEELIFLRDLGPVEGEESAHALYGLTVYVTYLGGGRGEEIYRSRNQHQGPGFETRHVYFRGGLMLASQARRNGVGAFVEVGAPRVLPARVGKEEALHRGTNVLFDQADFTTVLENIEKVMTAGLGPTPPAGGKITPAKKRGPGILSVSGLTPMLDFAAGWRASGLAWRVLSPDFAEGGEKLARAARLLPGLNRVVKYGLERLVEDETAAPQIREIFQAEFPKEADREFLVRWLNAPVTHRRVNRSGNIIWELEDVFL